PGVGGSPPGGQLRVHPQGGPWPPAHDPLGGAPARRRAGRRARCRVLVQPATGCGLAVLSAGYGHTAPRDRAPMTGPLSQLGKLAQLPFQWLYDHVDLMTLTWVVVCLVALQTISAHLHARRATRYRRALIAIKAEGGKVCEEFETCQHPI